MPNMIDYLQWRGDITFERSPFCEVDALIITYLAYVDLDDIVPEIGGGYITVRDAAQKFTEKYDPEKLKEDRSFVHMAYSVLEATGARTLTQLQDGGVKSVAVMLKQLEGVDLQTRPV